MKTYRVYFLDPAGKPGAKMIEADNQTEALLTFEMSIGFEIVSCDEVR